ncbi:MAG: hypothetical protein HQL32_00865 [Planctomycetes bacterium]|nr:hypothetical protein [Planctomycetota bacterium]
MMLSRNITTPMLPSKNSLLTCFLCFFALSSLLNADPRRDAIRKSYNPSWIGFLHLPKVQKEPKLVDGKVQNPIMWKQWKKEERQVMKWLPIKGAAINKNKTIYPFKWTRGSDKILSRRDKFRK